MIVYLAGPMSGYPEHNYPAFREAARQLRNTGHKIVSPHEENPCTDRERPVVWYYRKDLQTLLRCDAIALLPGWEASHGAQLELYVAQALGFKVFDVVGNDLKERS